MGSIAIIPSNKPDWQQKIHETMCQRGFSLQVSIREGLYNILLYKKILGRPSVIACYRGASMYVCGTLIYRSKGLTESASCLLKDHIQNSIDREQVLGHFIAVIVDNGSIEILTDPYAIIPLYYRTDVSVVSSSFLSLASFAQESLCINQQAVLEILFGQGVIPPNTQLTGINRYIPRDSPEIEGLKFNSIELPIPSEILPCQRQAAIQEQISRIDDYFSQIKTALQEIGSLLGMSGGFDSRMLYAFLKRHYIKPYVFTNWQNGESMDFKISEQIARHERIPINYIKTHVTDKTDSQLSMLKGYQYTDGQCRTQYYWSEVYSTVEYLRKINPKSYCSFNGVGGEQYRNSEGIHIQYKDWKTWLRYNIFKNWHNVINRIEVDKLIEKHMVSLKGIIDLPDRPSGKSIKMYLNRAYGYANRYYRAGFECQAADHLSPYCDAFLAEFAYRCVSHLGSLYDFQKGMLVSIDPDIARFTSTYGFALNMTPPLYYRIGKGLSHRFPQIMQHRTMLRQNYYSGLLTSDLQMINEISGGVFNVSTKCHISYEMYNMVKQLVVFSKQNGNGSLNDKKGIVENS